MSENKEKKPIYKKWWFWIIVIIIVACIFTPTDDTNNTTENSTANEVENVSEENSTEVEENITENEEEEIFDDDECYENLITVFNRLYPYGYSLGLLTGFEEINKSDTSILYGGTIKIENAYGNKMEKYYYATFDTNNEVQSIVIDNVEVYKK